MIAQFVRNNLRFYFAKLGQFLERKIDPTLTDNPEHLKTLQRDGIVIINDFLDRGQVQEIVDEIQSRTDLMADRKSSNIVKRNARYLLLDPEDQLPSTSVFFQSELVSGLAQAYLSKNAVLDRPAVQLKVEVEQSCIVDFFHVDEWRYLISGFLFLTDVGPEQAPLNYLKGSHKMRLWKLRKEQEFFEYYERDSDGIYSNEEGPYCGCYLPTEARRLRERHGFESITCTGDAGTLVIFDNLGLHRSTVLKKDCRLILSAYWMLPKTRAKIKQP